MKAHPFADVLPLLEDEAFDALVADIRANGLLEPITIHEGLILDGRNRYRACEAAGIEPKFLEFDGDDPLGFVLSLNVHRRHLSESQRGMVVAKLETLKHGGDRKGDRDANLHPDRRTLASLLNVSTRTAASARAVRDHATPELIRAVEQDRIAVSVAAGLATAPAAIQRRAVAEPERAHVLVKQERREQREVELAGKILALPDLKAGVLYADPPWRFEVYSRDTGLDRDASNHYPTMSLEEIKAVKSPASPPTIACCSCGRPCRCCRRRSRSWRHGASSTRAASSGRRTAPGRATGSQSARAPAGRDARRVPAPAPGTQWPSVIAAPVGEHSPQARRRLRR